VQKAGVAAVMPSYNEVDGIPNHSNRRFLEGILRQEWGFRGMVVSDYFAVEQLGSIHHVVANEAAAGRLALQTGIDLELPLPQGYKSLVDEVRSGAVSEALLDRAVATVLRAKFLSGLFENPFVDEDEAEKVQALPSNAELAREAARQAIILLKNDGALLPLDARKLKRVAVIGPNAVDVHVGGYSDPSAKGISVLEGIKDKLGASARVEYAEGARITESAANWGGDEVTPPDAKLDAQRIAKAIEVAKGSDVAIVVVGENESTSREAWADTHLGDRDSLDLIGRQDELVAAVLKTKVPTVVVLLHGRPNSINFIAENVPAILDGWYLGQESGHALADVLFGDINPAGRLPITIPRSVGQIPAYYYQKPSGRRGYLFANKAPLFVFGWGLSYTTFAYANVKVSPETIGTGGTVTVSVEVTNTGKVKGDEVAQLYIHDQISSVTRPVKELRAFERITLNPGESKTVKFTLDADALAFTNRDMKRVVEPGDFDIMIGPNSVSLTNAILHVVDTGTAH
jgi:beta-glucosidase